MPLEHPRFTDCSHIGHPDVKVTVGDWYSNPTSYVTSVGNYYTLSRSRPKKPSDPAHFRDPVEDVIGSVYMLEFPGYCGALVVHHLEMAYGALEEDIKVMGDFIDRFLTMNKARLAFYTDAHGQEERYLEQWGWEHLKDLDHDSARYGRNGSDMRVWIKRIVIDGE